MTNTNTSATTTQVKAYKELMADGSISKMRASVLSMMREGVDYTNTEIASSLGKQKNYTSGRLSELVRLGLVIESGTTICPQTKKTVKTFRRIGDNEVPTEIKGTVTKEFRSGCVWGGKIWEIWKDGELIGRCAKGGEAMKILEDAYRSIV